MQLDGYQVQERIGHGGMATVYKGVQQSLNRPVALKVLRKKLLDRSEVKARFEMESLIIARLKHPNIIDVIDRGLTAKGQPYFVMQYVEGDDLKTLIKKDELSMVRRIHIAMQICKALAYAHDNEIIHRDIKPANVLIDRQFNAYVLDFGIAHFCEKTGEQNDTAQQTRVGTVMGTAAYMAPELHASADNASVQSDLYAFGVLFYELLTAKLPLGRFEPPSVVNPKIPKAIDQIIENCLVSEPSQRPGSAGQIKNALLQLMRGAHLAPEQKERAKQTVTKAEDKFALLDVIKEDQYGAVYLFEDKTQHDFLVIKKRLNSHSGFRESRLLNNLPHANIVKIKGASSNERVFITVMEYLKGGCLQDRLIQSYALAEFFPIALQITEAMIFAHQNQIIHGNLRPKNILFTSEGNAKVSDFGFDEHYGEDAAGANWYNYFGEEKSVKADIYAAGVIFYQMLLGGQCLPQWRNKKLITHESFSDLPASMRQTLLKMLQMNPAERYDSFPAVLSDLKKLEAFYGAGKSMLSDNTAIKFSRKYRAIRIAAALLLTLAVSGVMYYAKFGSESLGLVQHYSHTMLTWLSSFI